MSWPARIAALSKGGGVNIYQPYTGIVATRGYFPNNRDTGSRQLMARSRHIARENLTSLKLVYANTQIATSGAEANPSNTMTLTASIEYPVGTFTQVKFSGSASASVSTNTLVTSDDVAVSIPYGAEFFVRSYQVGTSCALSHGYSGYRSACDYVHGEQINFAFSGLTDLTMGGTISNKNPVNFPNGGFMFGPAAILGTTRRRTFAFIGDSRCVGEYDDYTADNSGDVGEIARSIGAQCGYANMARGSSTAAGFLTAYALRAQVAAYATHIISEIGGADLRGGASAATVLANLQSIWALFPTKRVYQSTITPFTTSTDSWATVENQTPSTGSGPRVTLNDLLRAVPSGIRGCLEVADAVESARNSQKWTAGYTGDGVHANQTGYVAIRDSGAIRPNSL